jgi:hypothetical protein
VGQIGHSKSRGLCFFCGKGKENINCEQDVVTLQNRMLLRYRTGRCATEQDVMLQNRTLRYRTGRCYATEQDVTLQNRTLRYRIGCYATEQDVMLQNRTLRYRTERCYATEQNVVTLQNRTLLRYRTERCYATEQHELKQHNPWFDVECLVLLDQEERA